MALHKSNISTFNSKIASSTSDTLALCVTVILAFFILLTVFGNGLVCLVFYRQARLRTITYYPILSLAIADLLCGTLAMPAYIAKKYVTEGWRERLTCDVFRFTYFFAAYASVLSLTVISIERFIAIKRPMKHKTWLTTRKVVVALVISWLDAALVSALPFFWRSNDKDELCTCKPTKSWSIMVILTNVSFPFIVMFYCHFYTASFAIRYYRQRQLRSTKPLGQECQNSNQQAPRRGSGVMLFKRERDITRTMVIVLGIFIVCWAPSTFYYFIRMVCPRCYRPSFEEIKPVANAVVKLMTFANSCLNPLICCWLNETFRKAFKESLLKASEARRRRFVTSARV